VSDLRSVLHDQNQKDVIYMLRRQNRALVAMLRRARAEARVIMTQVDDPTTWAIEPEYQSRGDALLNDLATLLAEVDGE